MSRSPSAGRTAWTLRRFLDSEASGGLLLMAVAFLAIVVANSPLGPLYFQALKVYIGPLNVLHWINDALMALFFLLVGLEIKREVLDGQLSTWSRRVLPGVAAMGGMAVPALVYLAFNGSHPETLRGWAIPTATDIAFALGVLSLIGPRVPASLKIFLAALAIIDDLGAVIIIAIFYSGGLSLPDLAGAAAIFVALLMLGRTRTNSLAAFLIPGLLMWVLVYRSGVHATLAGVLLALTIPMQRTPAKPEASPAVSPLHRLEHALHKPVAFLVVPIFGFANAGVPLLAITSSVFVDPLSMGVAAGLFIGKVVGVFGAVLLLVKLRWADLPAAASWMQVLGVALLCGIGFTMSLFIGLLAFDDPDLQTRAKFGILAGSLISGLAGYVVLRLSDREKPAARPVQAS